MKHHVTIYLAPRASDDAFEWCIEDYIQRNHLRPSWYLYRTENGKPLILNNDFYYSKTLSDHFIAHAFSPIPLSIDFQAKVTTPSYIRIARRFYHPDELEIVLKYGMHEFYQIWCAKECFVKYYDLRIEKDFPNFSSLPLLNNATKHLHYTILECMPEAYGGLLTQKPVTYEFITLKKDRESPVFFECY